MMTDGEKMVWATMFSREIEELTERVYEQGGFQVLSGDYAAKNLKEGIDKAAYAVLAMRTVRQLIRVEKEGFIKESEIQISSDELFLEMMGKKNDD